MNTNRKLRPARPPWVARSVLLAFAWLVGSNSGAMDVTAAAWAPMADTPRWRPDSTYLQIGGGSSTDALTLGAQWDCRHEWTLGESLRLRGRWEISAARLRARTHWNDDDDAWYTKLDFSPIVRLSSNRHDRWYVDAGVGPTLVLPMYVSRERTFSSQFNFDSYLGFGVLLGDRYQHDLSVGLDHVSNAGLSEPNPGLNLYSVRYARRF